MFLRWGIRPPAPPRLGSAPDPVFLQWDQVSIEFTNQYTEFNTNQTTSVNITNLVRADRFLLIFLSPKSDLKSKFSKPFTISGTNKVN